MSPFRAPPHLETPRLSLRIPGDEDIDGILRFYAENREHLAPTDPPKPLGFHTQAYWSDRIAKARIEFQEEQALRLVMFSKTKPWVVLGTANFTQMFRGPFQACYLGYALDGASQGQGLMFEGLRAAIDYVFGELNFHRIMANHLPENARSARILRKLGFETEGTARDYLFIGDRWRDHVLTALTNPRWKA